MAEPGHSLNKASEAEGDTVKPRGDGVWTRVRATIDRRLCGLSQKLSLASALLLLATPLLLVHASAPSTPPPMDRNAATPAARAPVTEEATPTPLPAPGIEILRTRPVTVAAPRTQKPAATSPAPPPAAEPQAQPTSPAATPPTAPAAPPAWSEAEVDAARQQCAALLPALQVMAQDMPPIRQDRCGTPAPVSLKKLGPASGGVELTPPAVLNCAMVAQLSAFVEKTLQPAAREVFGSPVVRFNQASGYVCRGRNGDLTASGKISEHALANALDVASFTLADGRTIEVGKHWGPAARDFKNVPNLAQTPQQVPAAPAKSGDRSGLGVPVASPPAATKTSAPDAAATKTKEALFLRRLHQGACTLFGTVLGPEANEAHREHFHFDLHPRRHSHYCQ